MGRIVSTRSTTTFNPEIFGGNGLGISNAIKAQIKFFDEIYNNSMPYLLWHAFPAKSDAQYWPYHIQFWPLQRGEDKMKYLTSVEQITGLFLVDFMPEDATKKN